MAKKRLGRPPSKNPRKRVVNVTFAESEFQEIAEAADLSGLSRMGWLRHIAIREARKALR